MICFTRCLFSMDSGRDCILRPGSGKAISVPACCPLLFRLRFPCRWSPAYYSGSTLPVAGSGAFECGPAGCSGGDARFKEDTIMLVVRFNGPGVPC